MKTRIEKDSMGDVEVPKEALYGAQTQRAVQNFSVSGITMPKPFIAALGLIKSAAAHVNGDLGFLKQEQVDAICAAATEIAKGIYYQEFPIDVFQTGSGTSTNMNCNEVIANIANQQKKVNIHPNDHVNFGQSSNDVIPTAINVSACVQTHEKLLPSLRHLLETIEERATELKSVTKTGRTHLMDAMPVTFGQELSGWSAQIRQNLKHLENSLSFMHQLAIGGTAVGTGINTHPEFSKKVCNKLTALTGIEFLPSENYFKELSAQTSSVDFSAQLRGIAITLNKIANDLRWMNSGPLAGLAEITLPAVQPGSSIMPGKINPVIPESVCMVAAQVIGNDATIALAAQSGNFQLNVMLPVIAYNLLQSIEILANAARMLADKAIKGFTVNLDKINEQLALNPILVTSLNASIGYEKGAEIAKIAYAQKRSVKDVALELTTLSESELNALLDPSRLTTGGIHEKISS